MYLGSTKNPAANERLLSWVFWARVLCIWYLISYLPLHHHPPFFVNHRAVVQPAGAPGEWKLSRSLNLRVLTWRTITDADIKFIFYLLPILVYLSLEDIVSSSSRTVKRITGEKICVIIVKFLIPKSHLNNISFKNIYLAKKDCGKHLFREFYFTNVFELFELGCLVSR